MPSALLNEVYRPSLCDTRRYQLFYGGAGSGKSAFVATRAALDLLCGRNILIVRQVAKTLRASCWNELQKAIDRLGAGALFDVKVSDLTITARNCGAQALFCGLDDVEKIKSLTPRSGVLTDIWLEEATEAAYGDFKQLDKRLRGLSAHEKRFTMTFNPVANTHWLFKQFFTRVPQDAQRWQDENVSILRTTYRDNRFLTPDDVRALESERDPYYYQVYTLGQWGVLGDAIFHNVRVCDITDDMGGETRAGLDFGYASDPCGFLLARYDARSRRVMVTHEMCKRGLTNRMLADEIAPVLCRHDVFCDSAEPKSIAELRAYGLRAHAVRKGPDSVLHGIQWLRQQEILVSPSCPTLAGELATYRWQRDRDGNALPRPVDSDNHLIDALRYALENDMLRRTARTGN